MIPLDALLVFHNSSMTDFQLDRFVTVRAGGTPYGCFFQALRELFKRFRGVRADYLERRKLRVRLKRYQSLAAGTGHKAEMAAIRVDETLDAMEYLEKHIQTDEREFLRFYSQAAGLFAHLGFDREPPTSECLEKLERERWEHTALATIAEHHINGQPPGSMVSLIQSMPADMRARVLRRCFGQATNHQQRVKNLDALANWYLNYSPDMPEPLALSECETRKVLECCESSRLPKLLETSLLMDAITSQRNSMLNGSEYANHARFDVA